MGGVAILAGAEIASTGAGIFARHSATAAKQRQLQVAIEEQQVSANQKKIGLADKMQRLMGAQTAAQSASGFALASPSFGAIQANTFNEFAKDQQAESLNEMFKVTTLKEQQAALGQQGLFSDAEDIFNLVGSFAKGGVFKGKIPK